MSALVPAGSTETVFSVDTLLKYMGNDDNARAIVSKIVRDACAPAMTPLVQAGQAIKEQRLADAGRIFHSLRGSVGSLGAKRLVTASLGLELALAERRMADIAPLFATVELAYREVLEQAADWLSRNGIERAPD
ncbi:Hpt domain-containing protein [Rugamonas apoptosis]|uniref:Hpt domain-containing protein n=1 Tax=Rugamonas apoptosis TaxID=2758570 RepID=A0A7W2F8S4_9BURK|nr:Hpt domain-containing protein [Rugamonas apoptosis]MBA5687253.1 Hpt domain-containing protein [Rugamonas apoptosis]